MLASVLAVSLSSSVLAYSTCSQTVFPFANTVPKPQFDFSKGPTLTFPTNNVAITASGSVTVVDGCTIALNNVTFTGPATALLYGGIVGDRTGYGGNCLLTQCDSLMHRWRGTHPQTQPCTRSWPTQARRCPLLTLTCSASTTRYYLASDLGTALPLT